MYYFGLGVSFFDYKVCREPFQACIQPVIELCTFGQRTM